MKHLFTTFFLVITIIFTNTAQNGVPPISGARGLAMGGTGVTFTDINAAFSNQAGLAFLDGATVTLGADRRFLSEEIGAYSLAFAYPFERLGTFGLAVNYYGFTEYNETRIGISYARKLSSKLSIGAQFDYLGFSASENGNKSIITFEVGVHAQLIEGVSVGMHLSNPVRQEIIKGEKTPTVATLGIAYSPNKKLTVSGEFEKDIDFDMAFKAGIEYYIIDILSLRAGVSTIPTANSFGLGLRLKNGLQFDLASSYDYRLGLTPMLSVSYGFSSKTKK